MKRHYQRCWLASLTLVVVALVGVGSRGAAAGNPSNHSLSPQRRLGTQRPAGIVQRFARAKGLAVYESKRADGGQTHY